MARACVAALGAQLRALKAQILEFDRQIMIWHRAHETSKRLDEIPGVGPALATALVASIADPKAFRSGRDFSAWIGLVPKQHASFKHGSSERIVGGRQFTDMTEIELGLLLQSVGLSSAEYWTTNDVRPGRKSERWLNALARRWPEAVDLR